MPIKTRINCCSGEDFGSNGRHYHRFLSKKIKKYSLNPTNYIELIIYLPKIESVLTKQIKKYAKEFKQIRLFRKRINQKKYKTSIYDDVYVLLLKKFIIKLY